MTGGPTSRAVTCPSCGGAVEIRAAGFTTTVACQYCGSVLDVADPDVRLIAEYRSKMGELAIPLGRRGTLDGVEWEAIGWQARTDGEYGWEEYLLFNPYAGYRWLVLSEGEWTFGRTLADRPDWNGSDQAVWNGRRFEADDAPVEARTTRVFGEFYWRVKIDESVTAATFWAGENQLSLERGGGEVNWTFLSPVSAGQVRSAFAPPGGGAPPRDPRGFGRRSNPGGGGGQGLMDGGADAPASRALTGGNDLLLMFGMALVGSMVLFMTMALFAIRGAPATGSLSAVQFDGPERTTTIGPVVVSRAYQPVTVRAAAGGFDNRWVDLDYTLVDRQTKQAIEAESVVEHYSGSDGDGPWTEDNLRTSALFAGVPRGTYDVVISASGHVWGSSAPSAAAAVALDWGMTGRDAASLDFEAAAGGMLWGTFWLAVIALFAPPLLMAWLRHRASDDDD